MAIIVPEHLTIKDSNEKEYYPKVDIENLFEITDHNTTRALVPKKFELGFNAESNTAYLSRTVSMLDPGYRDEFSQTDFIPFLGYFTNNTNNAITIPASSGATTLNRLQIEYRIKNDSDGSMTLSNISAFVRMPCKTMLCHKYSTTLFIMAFNNGFELYPINTIPNDGPGQDYNTLGLYQLRINSFGIITQAQPVSNPASLIPNASTSQAGLMSAEDKNKLDTFNTGTLVTLEVWD